MAGPEPDETPSTEQMALNITRHAATPIVKQPADLSRVDEETATEEILDSGNILPGNTIRDPVTSTP